jgi:hypothetical protein
MSGRVCHLLSDVACCHVALTRASFEGRDTPLLLPLTRDVSQGLLREVTEGVGAVLPRITRLLEQEDMSESVVIQAAYIGLGPFFSEPSSGCASVKGKSRDMFETAGMKALRLSALGLIRTVSCGSLKRPGL